MTGLRGRMGVVCVTIACAQLLGCATLKFPWEKPVPHASKRNPVVQIVCLWEPAEGKDPDGKACRGFAGQVIFLGNKGGTPVAVEGLVRVKEFDQFSGTADEHDPFHQFDFDAKAWNIHMLKGSLGATYNVFIPYMRKGNHDAHCELIVEFTPDDGGPTVVSSVSSLLLKGKHSSKEVAAAKEAASMIVHTPKSPSDFNAKTTTIPLDGRGTAKEAVAGGDPMAARLERMERMMQDFAAQQAQKPVRPAIAAAAAVETAPLGNRFSLNGRKPTADAVMQTSASTAADDENALQTAARIPAKGRPHHFLSAHPLAAEENSSVASSDANVAQRSPRRHPLADEPAFAKNGGPQRRETLDATLVVPEELTDAPVWTLEENTAGHATLSDDLDGKTTQVP